MVHFFLFPILSVSFFQHPLLLTFLKFLVFFYSAIYPCCRSHYHLAVWNWYCYCSWMAMQVRDWPASMSAYRVSRKDYSANTKLGYRENSSDLRVHRAIPESTWVYRESTTDSLENRTDSLENRTDWWGNTTGSWASTKDLSVSTSVHRESKTDSRVRTARSNRCT